MLVTGGGGQLGLAFVRSYPGATVLRRADLDIADAGRLAEVMAEVKPEVVINGAAFTAVDRAEMQPEEVARINVAAVIGLARAARSAGAKLVQVSSDYVYPGDKAGPYVETDKTRPLSVYGRSKLQSEIAARAAGGECLIVRTSWVFGDGKNFVRAIIGAAQVHDTLDVVQDQRGRPTYAQDLAGGIVGLLDAGARGVYHVTGGGPVASWADVAEFALQQAGLTARVRRVTSEQYYAGRVGPVAPRPANSELNCSKAGEAGVVLRSWQDAVADYVKEIMSASPRL
ncbi:MAG: dTDP-4-dehydrorhamnose reductase [Actinomycetota bacterium]